MSLPSIVRPATSRATPCLRTRTPASWLAGTGTSIRQSAHSSGPAIIAPRGERKVRLEEGGESIAGKVVAHSSGLCCAERERLGDEDEVVQDLADPQVRTLEFRQNLLHELLIERGLPRHPELLGLTD